MSLAITQVAEVLQSGQSSLLSGLEGTAKSYFVAQLARTMGSRLVYICSEIEQAYDMARNLRGILGKERVHLLTPRNYLIQAQGEQNQDNIARMSFFSEILDHPRQNGVLIMTVPSLLFATVSPVALRKAVISIEAGTQLDMESFPKQLINSGYVRRPMVENPGQFSVRGGILDIFPLRAREPVRLELYGDEVESLRRFSPQTQHSAGDLKSVEIWPVEETGDEDSRVWDYLPEKWPVWADDFIKLQESWGSHLRRYRNFERQARKEKKLIRLQTVEWDELVKTLDLRPTVYHSFFARSPGNIPVQHLGHIAQREVEPLWTKPDGLLKNVQDWQSRGWRILLAVPDKSIQDRIKRDLEENLITTGYEFVRWNLERGFVSSTLELALVSEKDLGRRRKNRGKAAAPRGGAIITPSELSIGDHVVHEQHGIGLFQGVSRQEIDGVYREYLSIQYAGTDRLYLPIDKLNMLHRYTGGGPAKLNKLGGMEWERTKSKVRESVQEMTEELLALYAERDKIQGFAFSPESVWQREFAEGFEYEETPDQAKAVREVLADMEKPRPMDRLVCGDVGYGKTEVAMRAAFKAIMDHKQVAVLVPTTILAEQHLTSFQKRFEAFPAVIEVLSRFKTASQQKKILEDLRKGIIDIVIGTHRLLSRDVEFKDLGLLVVDEEHRFGVRQKERIKALTKTVDVLSLTATPIPRTLHMAMTGLRDLSVIETPPPARYPVNTYVMEYSPDIVQEAIQTEVERGGQIFFVHNRIHSLDRIYREVADLVGDLTIDIAHGRMDEKELARVMKRFLEGESDILLSTSIIESGLDLPNVNTLIVDEADRMGLAQLYQLRGRIGRSNRVAYAYITYRPERYLSELAQKRLSAIRELVELGSGMRIAMRDLEIRGAGNILGAEQHGHIEAVGFELYCRLLEEVTSRTRGHTPPRTELPVMDIKIDSYIPDSYIDDPSLKIQIYRQMMMAVKMEEIAEIERGIRDRFGVPPAPVENLLRISRLRLLAHQKNIRHINTDPRSIEMTLEKPLGESAAGLAGLQEKYGFKISVANQNTLVLKSFQDLSLDALEDLLAII